MVDEKPLPARTAAGAPGFEPASLESTSRAANPVQTSFQGESIRSKEIPARDIREVQVIPKEKLELILSSIQDLSHTFKELKNMIHNVQSEVKDLRKDEKEMQARIKDLTITLNDIKTKKRWFSFL